MSTKKTSGSYFPHETRKQPSALFLILLHIITLKLHEQVDQSQKCTMCNIYGNNWLERLKNKKFHPEVANGT